MNNINKVSDSFLCSNCGACNAICPKGAIRFRYTSMGRMYANADSSCIDCGVCLKVCPSMDLYNLHEDYTDKYYGNILRMLVGKATDTKVFNNAQSGGASTAILSFLFDKKQIDGAVVCRMTYGVNEPDVKAVVVTQKEQLVETQKSCYTPVDILSALKETKSLSSVAIVGLPCHIQGVVSLQRTSKKFSNVKYKIGLVCDRTLTKTIYGSLLGKRKNVLIKWRGKGFANTGKFYQYNSAPVIICNPQKKDVVLPNAYRFALKDFYTAPRCRVCYDKINVNADIVLGDPWRLDGIDEVYGESLILTRTSLGDELIAMLVQEGKLQLREYDKSLISKSQLVEERKEQIATYSKAFSVLHPLIDSYLLNQGEDAGTNDEKIESARQKLLSFITHENMSKEEIVKESRKIMKKAFPFHRKIKELIISYINKNKF